MTLPAGSSVLANKSPKMPAAMVGEPCPKRRLTVKGSTLPAIGGAPAARMASAHSFVSALEPPTLPSHVAKTRSSGAPYQARAPKAEHDAHGRDRHHTATFQPFLSSGAKPWRQPPLASVSVLLEVGNGASIKPGWGIIRETSGADLTFATHPATGSRSECQIQSSTRTLYLLVVL